MALKTLLVLISLLVALPLSAAAPKYHLELEANPGAPFPFLGKFGTVDLHVFSAGVRADTIWLDGFTRTGTPTVTVVNPFGRMYTDVPVREISSIVARMAGVNPLRAAVGTPLAPMRGKVRGIDATRHRLSYGPEAWIDIWTTDAIADNPQLRALVDQLVRGISPGTAAVARKIPGVPLYVELNFNRFKKLPLLRMKKLTLDDSEAADALTLGALYFKAPMLDALWK